MHRPMKGTITIDMTNTAVIIKLTNVSYFYRFQLVLNKD